MARPAKVSRKAPVPETDLDTLIGWEPVATRVLTSAEREAWHILRKALAPLPWVSLKVCGA